MTSTFISSLTNTPNHWLVLASAITKERLASAAAVIGEELRRVVELAQRLSACAGPCDYTLSQAGAVAADGCYTRSAPAVFTRKGSAVALYRRATAEGRLLVLEFTTLADYLFKLRATCTSFTAAGLGARAMLFLAAAVSDFYVPHAKMAQHKIQSGGKKARAGLTLALDATPKMLRLARRRWAPGAFCVSFKLETDVAILLQKARGAIAKYGVHLVVANELHSRYREVHLVNAGIEAVDKILCGAGEIEDPLVAAVAKRHRDFVEGKWETA